MPCSDEALLAHYAIAERAVQRVRANFISSIDGAATHEGRTRGLNNADDKKVFYKDIGDKFLNKEGALERKVMPDLLHLSAEGYKIWAEAIKDDIAKLTK